MIYFSNHIKPRLSSLYSIICSSFLARRSQEAAAQKTMSIKKTHSLNNGDAMKVDVAKKGRSFDRCFSFMEISLEPGKQLKDMDSDKLKSQIRKWAKAVVAYARQVSGRFGSSSG